MPELRTRGGPAPRGVLLPEVHHRRPRRREVAPADPGDARAAGLQRGEQALLYFPGQDGGPRGDNYFHVVIRDFHLKHPLSDSRIRVWVLPVEGYVGHPKGYHGYSLLIPVEGFRGNELFRNKKLLHGLKEKWPGSQKCRFCQSTTELKVCQQADCP